MFRMLDDLSYLPRQYNYTYTYKYKYKLLLCTDYRLSENGLLLNMRRAAYRYITTTVFLVPRGSRKILAPAIHTQVRSYYLTMLDVVAVGSPASRWYQLSIM